ncbi:S-adenosyl-L-methionine-dependent methyltransferase [Talaromyces proteolyticus]|uniref:S-adenosyl-L-methionine-dependent methyltransferase n=1 Tax=Talaromyces proteolyticus TaxID=1131652 RepID=A0AAD4PUC5_9EURO|nr:S-adenosyl-L-methionine-dependent methyltransferase [Talaromyces proteolyticus]KAH8689148.1 S-adenosyl-L-methionine-dependent methyltransferase [Talaromyces proteolyticus]
MADLGFPDEPSSGHVEVDRQATENDSVYGDELSNYTTSLTSSVYNYRRENGRTYHGYQDGEYLFPNDEDESDRLDIVHEMTLTMMGRRLYLAPIGSSPRRVVDLGTGTGIWPIEFGDQHPSAEVLGVDLSPTQPSLVPPNVRFLVDDIEKPWLYSQAFDFVHVRGLACCVKDYANLIRQAYDNTAPGQWVEFQDWDTNLVSEDGSTNNTFLEQYYNVVLGSFQKAGYVNRPGLHLEQWLRDTGFENVHVRKYPVPLGTWPKDKHLKKVGAWNFLQAESGFESAAMAVLTRNEGWSRDEVTVLVAKARQDVKNREIHSLFYFYVAYGQKPGKSSSVDTSH